MFLISKKIVPLALITLISMSTFSSEKFEFTAKTYEKTQQQTEQEKLEWLMHPAANHLSREKWDEIIDGQREQKERKQTAERMFGQAKVITIDTRNQKVCNDIKHQLERSSNIGNDQILGLCETDEKSPYVTVMAHDEYQSQGVSFSELNDNQQKIVKQTRNFTVLGTAVIGMIWMMPEEISNWDEEKVGKKIGSKYVDHIKEGPVVDNDAWAVNYIGHPYSGAAYYVVARHAGLSKMQSFGYSVFMSTVFWEYGLEAVFEEPSLQDLIITPVIGSLMGEGFMRMSKLIEENNGLLLGSKGAGTVALALMNPAGAMLDGINDVLDNDFIKDARTYFYTRPESGDAQFQPQFKDPGFIGVGIELKF